LKAQAKIRPVQFPVLSADIRLWHSGPTSVSAREGDFKVKVGKQGNQATSISTSNADTIVVRGRDLCRDLIGSVSLTEHFWLLVTGQLPTRPQAQVLDACLVAIAEHGLVPSVQAARMTYAAGPEAMQGAVAAGILGCGSVILGSAENAGRLLARVIERAAGKGTAAAAFEIVQELRAARTAIPGYGHPQHKAADPRVARVVAVADQVGLSGFHVAAARDIEAAIRDVTGKSLVLNVSGAIPAVLLDAGFPIGGLKGVPILARTASLVAHLVEEQMRPIGFAIADGGSDAIGYDGKTPDNFVAEAS
jgi:citrate synthase